MKKVATLAAVLAVTFLAAGCALTDYDGFPGHQTQSEAKLWGTDIAFSGFGADDGTYTTTVKYDNRAGQGVVTINNYRNPVVGSFTRDGQIDQDGDDIQGSGGILGGKFLPYFRSVDSAAGTCEFFANIVYDKSANGPGVAVCISGAQEEIDKDLDLQAAFSSLDHLLNQIWSGALKGSFSMEVTELRINGAAVPVAPFSIYASAESLRPGRFLIDGSQPNAAALIQSILDNTEHLAPVNLGLVFSGGLRFDLPSNMTVAFNHDALWNVVN